MADPDQLLREGDVSGARAALVDIVRAKPGDEQARMFLFQLLAIAGEWDKARNQLETLTRIASEAQMLGVTYNQVLAAEKERAGVFSGAAEVTLLAGEGGWAEGVAAGINLVSKGDVANAIAARDAAFDNAPDMPGSFNGEPFEWIADGDSRFGPCLEVIIGGRYGLLPFDMIAGIKSEGPQDLRDTIWYPVEIALRSGQSAAAFLFARYPGSETSDDDRIKLGRMSDWQDHDWGSTGLGQRLWSLSDGRECGMLELRELTFDQA